MAQTKKSLTETREKLSNRISELEALALSAPLSQENQDELAKAKAQLMQVEDQLNTMDGKMSEKDALEAERKHIEDERAQLESEKAKIEEAKTRILALQGPTKESYVVPEGQEDLLHLKVAKGAAFNPKTGEPIHNWKVITLSSSEWTNLKRCFDYYEYEIVAVLHDPFNEVEAFLEEFKKAQEEKKKNK